MHQFIKYGLILLTVIPVAGGVGVMGYSYSKAATQPYGKGNMAGIAPRCLPPRIDAVQ